MMSSPVMVKGGGTIVRVPNTAILFRVESSDDADLAIYRYENNGRNPRHWLTDEQRDARRRMKKRAERVVRAHAVDSDQDLWEVESRRRGSFDEDD